MNSRRTRRLSRLNPRLDLTPMIDVVFLLIIFFMVSTTFISPEANLPVDLPRSQTSQLQSADLPTVTITKDLKIFLGGTAVKEADIAQALQIRLADQDESVVVLRADRTVPHGLVVQVMDQIKRSGARRIAIATGG
ncbi:MAG: biopolymer transporter ExbD [Truepera sp.]|nr:biopolymer transporter ExbD [Truepera sp.]